MHRARRHARLGAQTLLILWVALVLGVGPPVLRVAAAFRPPQSPLPGPVVLRLLDEQVCAGRRDGVDLQSQCV